MNEPTDISASAWLEIANRVIGAIRDTGAANLLTVPGTNYTGAHSWRSSGNMALAGVVDPGNRFAIEVHQYFDDNSSGTTPKATSGSCGTDRLREFQDWARKNKLKAFLGEFGAAANPASLNALADICQEMSANPDVWLGWTAWAAGPFWPPDYMFNLGPASDGSLRKQTRILAAHARPASADYWIKPGAVIDLDLARERVSSCRDLTAALAFNEPRVPHSGQPGSMRVQGPLLGRCSSRRSRSSSKPRRWPAPSPIATSSPPEAKLSWRAPWTAPCGQPGPAGYGRPPNASPTGACGAGARSP
jgi:hypothetical protein